MSAIRSDATRSIDRLSFEAEIARQFDAVAHSDRTQALWPLDPDPGWIPEGEAPETYPFGV